MTSKTITLDEWIETFKPEINQLADNSSFDFGNGGMMFETYGPEVEYVNSQNLKQRVWTYIDGEDGTYIVNGARWVNRIGYFVAEVPYVDGEWYEVEVDKY